MDWSIGNILWILVGGSIVGVVARLVLPGRQSVPLWSVVVAGIIGMFAGDALARVLGVYETGGFDWIRHGLQVAVGVVLVALAAAVFSGRSRDVGA